MPYIKPEDRPALDEAINKLHANIGAGGLAYVVYRLMKRATLGGTFVTFTLITGSVFLTLCRFVFKEVMPYEDIKERENGDVEC